MATVVNQQPANTGDNGLSTVLGVIVLLALVVLFLFYGLPFMGHGFGGGSQVNLPSSVNVNTSK